MAAIRGQVIRVDCPWMKIAVYSDDDTYIIPGADSVTLGGTRQYANYNMEIDENDAKGIWQRTTTLLPNLKKAKVISEHVGLRPHRSQVRVERENRRLANGKMLRLVHHYGHGGHGWAISPGSAITASALVGEVLNEIR